MKATNGTRAQARWLRMPDAPETFEVCSEPFVTVGVHRKSVSAGTLETKMFQPAVMVRDGNGTDFLLSLSKPGFVEFFSPATEANGGSWNGIAFVAQGVKENGEYRAILKQASLVGSNGHGR